MPPTQGAPPNASKPNASQLLSRLMPHLSSERLAEQARTYESPENVLFAFHPWPHAIPNSTLAGYSFGVHHFTLPRMQLIELVLWKNPLIQPRQGGFAVGAITTGGAFPSGSVGSRVDQISQYPSVSAKKLLEAYSAGGANNLGLIVFRTLGGDTDEAKLESVLLFEALMQTPLEEGAPTGQKVLLEDMPRFLNEHAPKLLERALEEGISIDGVPYRFSKKAAERGEGMIADIHESIKAITHRALNEGSGILPMTKRDLTMAGKGVKEVKYATDRLDDLFLVQYPSFSMDTEVERAARATQNVVNAIREQQTQPQHSDEQLLSLFQQTVEQNRLMTEQLAKANELNQKLFEELQKKNAA